ncbi:MAG: hypothetical protein Q9160_009220 [Pyrenula sp. 1 TL-2023]
MSSQSAVFSIKNSFSSFLIVHLGCLIFTGNILQALAQAKWPDRTQATGSTTAEGNGTYDAIRAIDGNVHSFWNDATLGQFPDVLTIIPPDPVTLTGISVISDGVGWITSYSVRGQSANGSWEELSSLSQIPVPLSMTFFKKPSSMSRLQIVVQDAMKNQTNVPLFSRINEVFPHYWN